jgi:hypothetical protein
MDNQQVCRIGMKGLNNEIRMHLNAMRIKNFGDLVTEASNYERMIKEKTEFQEECFKRDLLSKP